MGLRVRGRAWIDPRLLNRRTAGIAPPHQADRHHLQPGRAASDRTVVGVRGEVPSSGPCTIILHRDVDLQQAHVDRTTAAVRYDLQAERVLKNIRREVDRLGGTVEELVYQA